MTTVHVEHCMGTAFSFRIPAPGCAADAIRAAVTWLHEMDAIFSTYRADSQICRLDAGTFDLTDAAPEVRYVLEECARLTAETDGYFSARPDGVRLDPSGYVKGWAVQHAADLLAAAGSRNHYVNGGGDVVCAGRPEPGRGWRIGIADPHRSGILLEVVDAAGPVAVATSGLAERGAHIYDPHTCRPVTTLASVTVIADELVTADTYATAAVAMGLDDALDWLMPKPVRAVIVTADGARHDTGTRH